MGFFVVALILLQRKAVQDEKLKFLKEHFMNITPFKEKQSASQLPQKGQTNVGTHTSSSSWEEIYLLIPLLSLLCLLQ